MIIFPAVDILGGKAVRLLRGNYDNVSVFGNNPAETAKHFEDEGARYIHIVDLDGARSGDTPNFDAVSQICKETSLFTEIGGGIRNIETVKRYLDCGINRVIIGTAAVTDPSFLANAVSQFGKMIAVGADVRNGFISIKGWLEDTTLTLGQFALRMQDIGVTNIICTDISKDGALSGTNLEMYGKLSASLSIDITASGGISSIEEIIKLSEMGLYGAIVGKAVYSGNIRISDAIKVSSEGKRL